MNVILEKIEISAFGKLNSTVVTLDKGINILSAPNESGKSTLAAFIKFALYGFAGARAHSLTENERKFYSPWGGETVEGSLTLTADGTRYTVHRVCTPSGKETVEIINRATGKNEFIGAVPGEVFFGVNDEVFARTLFFRQLTVMQSKDEILAERLQNIAMSADEQVGTKKAVERLKDCKNELVGKAGKGIIPSLERERDSLEEMLTSSVDMRSNLDRLRGEINNRSRRIASNNEKLSELTSERKNIEKYDALIKLQNIKRLTEETEALKSDYEASAAKLKSTEGSGLAEIYTDNTEYVSELRNLKNLEASLKTAEEDRASISSCGISVETAEAVRAKRTKSKRIGTVALIAAMAALVGGAALWGFDMLGIAIGCLSASALLVLASAVLLGRNPAKEYGFADYKAFESAVAELPAVERRISDAERRIDEMKNRVELSKKRVAELDDRLNKSISEYIDTEKTEDYSRQIELVRALCTAIEKKHALWKAKNDELQNSLVGVDTESLAELARGAVEPERDRIIVDRELNFYNQQNAQLAELNRTAELDCASFEAKSGDPAVLVGKRDSLDAQINELTVKHKAYETAIRLIGEASDYMKSAVAPRISARADEYFSAATGRKYSGLEIDTRLSMSVGEDFRRSCEQLSAGTRDSAYLSLRLALADMLFGGCGVPIMLDDAFVRIDDERLALMSGALSEAAKKHQIIILTHSDREKNAISESGAKYTEISIKTV